jgi:integrase
VDFGWRILRLGTRKRAGGGMEHDWIPLTARLADTLAAHRQRTESDLIFPGPGGKPYKTRASLLRRLCSKAGVRRFGFHGIRHLSASLMACNGMAITSIQAVLRHQGRRI